MIVVILLTLISITIIVINNSDTTSIDGNHNSHTTNNNSRRPAAAGPSPLQGEALVKKSFERGVLKNPSSDWSSKEIPRERSIEEPFVGLEE